MPRAPYTVHYLLQRTCSCGGGRAVAQHAAIFSMLSSSARLQPSEPKKKCQGRPDIGGLASLGWMGKQGVAIESGCCRSTGRVPMMEQSEYESANEELVIQAQAGHYDPTIWIKWNITCNIICDIAYNITYDIVQRTYNVWLKTYDIAYNESIQHSMSWHA